MRGVRCQVAEILLVPEREGPSTTCLDVLPHVVRQTESGQLDRAALPFLLQFLRGGLDADGRRRDDALQVRVCLNEPLRRLCRVGRIVIAVDRCDQLHVLVLRQLERNLHELDPRVLVSGGRRCREDGDVARVADLLSDRLDHRDADQRVRRRRDEDHAGGGCRVGVVRDDLDALRSSPLESRRHRVRIRRRDHDSVVALLDGGVDEWNLRRPGDGRRPFVRDRVAERLAGFLGPDPVLREHRNGSGLGQEEDLVSRLLLGGACSRRQSEGQRGDQCEAGDAQCSFVHE
jgi:hypothetical protein